MEPVDPDKDDALVQFAKRVRAAIIVVPERRRIPWSLVAALSVAAAVFGLLLVLG